jgi:flagellar basal body rod protein FlgG
VIDGISASLSGMANALRRLGLTANNIANQQTPGYQALRAENVEVAEGGVAIGAIARNPTAGPPSLDSSGAPDTGGSNVDPAVEQVNLLLSRRQFEANLTALKAQDEIIRSLLNVVDNRIKSPRQS